MGHTLAPADRQLMLTYFQDSKLPVSISLDYLATAPFLSSKWKFML